MTHPDDNNLLRPTASSQHTTTNIRERAVDETCFKAFVSSRDCMSLIEHGDSREKAFAESGLFNSFRGYENIWRLLITPATNRIFGERTDIRIRDEISDEMLLLCQFHYTVMSSLLRAQLHLERRHDGFYFDFFCALQNVSEQVELFLLVNDIIHGAVLSSWEELVSETDNLRSDSLRDKFLRKLPCGGTEDWKKFRNVCADIAKVRNALVHGPEIATYLKDAETELIPRTNKHQKLLWTYLPESEFDLKRYFTDADKSTQKLFESFLEKLNAVWILVDSELTEEKIFSSASLYHYGVNPHLDATGTIA